MMPGSDPVRIQEAFGAAIGGDVELFVARLAPDLEWRGVQRGHFWSRVGSYLTRSYGGS
jgi:hypothetical protein